jgi:mannose-6-phosphate isomerase-like protein (cupin superfamily)
MTVRSLISESRYEPEIYARMDETAVRADLERDGWDPRLFTDPSGTVYPPHRHAETKLLAFIRGSMEVRVGDQIYRCLAGDKLVIPGGTKHAAVAGPEGCTFFWSEQLRETS